MQLFCIIGRVLVRVRVLPLFLDFFRLVHHVPSQVHGHVAVVLRHVAFTAAAVLFMVVLRQ